MVVAVAATIKDFPRKVERVVTRRAEDLSTDKSVGFPGFIAELCFLTVLPSDVSIELTAVGDADTVRLFTAPPASIGVGGAGGKAVVAHGAIGLFNGFVLRRLSCRVVVWYSNRFGLYGVSKGRFCIDVSGSRTICVQYVAVDSSGMNVLVYSFAFSRSGGFSSGRIFHFVRYGFLLGFRSVYLAVLFRFFVGLVFRYNYQYVFLQEVHGYSGAVGLGYIGRFRRLFVLLLHLSQGTYSRYYSGASVQGFLAGLLRGISRLLF